MSPNIHRNGTWAKLNSEIFFTFCQSNSDDSFFLISQEKPNNTPQ